MSDSVLILKYGTFGCGDGSVGINGRKRLIKRIVIYPPEFISSSSSNAMKNGCFEEQGVAGTSFKSTIRAKRALCDNVLVREKT